MKAIVLTESTMNELVTELSKRIFVKVVQMQNLSGTDILNLPAHPQVGQFIMFQIFQEWRTHTTKIKHPFFDFKHEEVIQALQQFQNVLSNHIKIEQKDFKQMLDKACWNTLRLLLNPAETIIQFFFTGREHIPVSLVKQYATYFSDFDFCLLALIDQAENKKNPDLLKEECIRLIPRIFSLWEQGTNNSLSDYRAKRFMQLTGFDINKLIEAVQPDMQDIVVKPETPQILKSDDPVIENNPVEKHEPTENKVDKKENTEAPNRVYQQFQTTTKFSEKKSYSLDQIPLHKQFQFIQKLFGGNHQKYNETLQKIQSFEDINSANEWLQNNFDDKENEIYQEFYEMILRSFGG